MIPGDIFIIRPGALGDSVLTLPVLSAIVRASCCSLTVLGTPASFAFLRNYNPRVEVRDFASSDWLGLFADGGRLSLYPTRIVKNTGTAIVYLSNDTRPIARRLNAIGREKTILQIDPPKASELDPGRLSDSPRCFTIDWRDLTPNHAARRLLDPLAPLVWGSILREALDPYCFECNGWLYPSEAELGAARCFFDSTGGRCREFVAIHPGSGGRRKCWPAARYAELAARIARELNCVPLVFFGPADDRTRAEFEAAVPTDIAWRVAQRSLQEALALLHSCRCFVGNDSGMAHLAARVCPVLAIFGPTDPAIWAPIGRMVKVITAARGDLKSLNVDYVFNELKRSFFDKKPRPEPRTHP